MSNKSGQMTNPLREYYKESKPNLNCITDLSHRHFRFMLNGGRFLKINDRIRNEDVLKKWLVRYSPSDVYYSTSCWLKPEILGRREKTPLAANIFLSSDIVFDIDRSPFSKRNLEKARIETLRLIDFIDSVGRDNYEIRYIAFSGSKGFHVVCNDLGRYESDNPLRREDIAKEKRRGILEKIQSEEIDVDGKITVDTRRIIRVPGTINSKTCFVCTVLSRGQIEKPIDDVLKYVSRVNINTPKIPFLGDESMLRMVRKIPGHLNRLGVRLMPQFYYCSFLVNCVPGIKRQIPFFEYPSGRNIKRIEAELNRLQNDYNLSDIYLFKSRSRISGICLRTLQTRRLEKIMNASSSININSLIKYKQLFFRVGPKRDQNKRVLEPAPEYVRTIKAEGANNPKSGNSNFISRPHYMFLKGFGVPMHQYEFMHGRGDVFLTHAIVEN
jgi:DNA primase catalytic subunit